MNPKKNLLLFGGLLGILLLGAIIFGLFTFKVSPVSAAQSVLKAITFQSDDDNDAEESGDVDEAGDMEGPGDVEEAGESEEIEGVGEKGPDETFTGSVPAGAGQIDLQSLVKITIEEARQIAQTANPGAQVSEVEQEVENGYLIYEVELDNGLEVVVDAGNGEILRSGQDD